MYTVIKEDAMKEWSVTGCAYAEGLRGSMHMFKGVTEDGKVIVGRLLIDTSIGAYLSGRLQDNWLREQTFYLSSNFTQGWMYHIRDTDNNHLWLSSDKGLQDLDDLL